MAHEQIEIKSAKAVTKPSRAAKPHRHEQRPDSAKPSACKNGAPNAGRPQMRPSSKSPASSSNQSAVLKLLQQPKGTTIARDHEGHGLATAFGPWVFRRGGQAEAGPKSCLREIGRSTHLPDCQIWPGAMMVVQQSAPAQAYRSSRRSRAGSAGCHADRPVAASGIAKCFGPIRQKRSVRICSGGASGTGLGERPTAVSPARRSGLFDQMMKTYAAKPNGKNSLAASDQARFRTGPDMEGQELPRHGAGRGFAHGGKTFASLSEIASEITGTRWNGPAVLRAAVDI